VSAPRGAFVMSVTPFAAGGAVDERLLRGHVDWLAAAGVGIFLCSQGSGEGDLLRADEKRRVYEIGVDAAAGRVPVWAAGVGLAGASADIAALARDAYAAGVDGVYVLGPRPSPASLRADEVEAYYRVVIEAVDGPVIVADNTYLTGYALPDGVLAALVASYPQIAAVVVAGAGTDPAAVTVDVPVLVGNTALARHPRASGFLCAEGNVAPELAAAGDIERLVALNRACTRHGPRSLKAAIFAIGRDAGTVRPPYLPLPDAEQAEVAAAVARVIGPHTPNSGVR
jgi:4-hydroxy-tetrahydrodipicolinate synthase